MSSRADKAFDEQRDQAVRAAIAYVNRKLRGSTKDDLLSAPTTSVLAQILESSYPECPEARRIAADLIRYC